MYLSVNQKYSTFNSQLAQNESNDCFVRALAIATDVDYNTAHTAAKDLFCREDKKGTEGFVIWSVFDRAEQAGIEIGRKKLGVKILSKAALTNKYKVKGEVILRKKTLKSFINSHPTGRYIVTVAGHALAVVNGELADWGSRAYQPTRKVLSAYKIEIESDNSTGQLSLF